MLLHIDHRHIFGEEDAEKLSIQNVDMAKFTQKENDIISFPVVTLRYVTLRYVTLRYVTLRYVIGGYVYSTLARRIRNSKTWKSKQNQDSMSILPSAKVDISMMIRC